MIGRSGDVVCEPHRTRGGDEKRRFFGLASKPVATVCQWFGLKTTMTISWFGLCLKTKVGGLMILTSKSPRRFIGLGLKTKWEEVCRFVPQN
jgi:hypothetical protein